jgi:predicted deacylase
MTSRVWADIDLDAEGKRAGYLYAAHSVTRSGYGHVATPIVVIRNGPGPTALLMGGNHGDEYEGQVALLRLVREMEARAIKGRIIAIPMANVAAAGAGVRTSPLDEGNLNRAFPGNADGTPTFAMAHYYDTVLFPQVDAFIDIHSGGTSMDYMPLASICLHGEPTVDAKARALLAAFGAPISMVWDAVDPRMAEIAAAARGVPAVSGEFGGAGTVKPACLAVVERGLRNVLRHMGIMAGKPEPTQSRPMETPARAFYAFASASGLFEPLVALGDMVEAGRPCGLIHFPDEPLREPVTCRFDAAGLVVCLRQPARVERGDCIAHLARDTAS